MHYLLIKFKDLLNHCAQTNTLAFNKDKAVEEASEFIEAATKHVTKAPENPKKPTLEDILGEYADLQYRGLIYLASICPELTLEEIQAQVDEHIEEKLTKLEGYKEDGKYRNGL